MKLPMPVICECGFSTMNAKKAYGHAMKHVTYEELAQTQDDLDQEVEDGEISQEEANRIIRGEG